MEKKDEENIFKEKFRKDFFWVQGADAARQLHGYFLKKNVALQINFCFWRKKNLFLRVYKRRDKFKYLVKKRVHRQNKVIRGLLVCIIQKFNGYDVIKKSLEKKEKKDFEPPNIVYEPIMDNSRIKCFYTDKSYIAFRGFIDRKKRESIGSNILQPGSFATGNYFNCSKNEFMKHRKRWTSREGIVYSFENDKIISFQDNFRQMGDVPFTFYFHFETTTGNDIFKDPKMFVISYCQIFSFHGALNLDKIVIFRSFQQSVEEMYDSRHFRPEHVPFFDKVTFDQLKDAASAVIALEKTTSFAELFSLELKFTKDTLQGWFRQTIE